MGKNNVANLLTSVDELFTTQEERDAAKRETVVDIPISEISDFPNHPFKVRMDEAMMEMADSIKRYGVLVPGMVRPKEGGGYEMVSGHWRKMGSELAQKTTMPCLLRDLTDDEAIIIMVDSNLQREKILPSEKAFAYKMKLEAMKRQGQRTDLTSSPVDKKLKGLTSAQQVGEKSGDSQPQIYRYIRLTYLIPSLLDIVDEGKIAMRPAVELSYLPKKLQEELLDTCEMLDCTPSLSQAVEMKKLAQAGRLKAEDVVTIMSRLKANQQDKLTFRKDTFAAYFPKGYPARQMEESIINLLKERKRQLGRRRDEAR